MPRIDDGSVRPERANVVGCRTNEPGGERVPQRGGGGDAGPLAADLSSDGQRPGGEASEDGDEEVRVERLPRHRCHGSGRGGAAAGGAGGRQRKVFARPVRWFCITAGLCVLCVLCVCTRCSMAYDRAEETHSTSFYTTHKHKSEAAQSRHIPSSVACGASPPRCRRCASEVAYVDADAVPQAA